MKAATHVGLLGSHWHRNLLCMAGALSLISIVYVKVCWSGPTPQQIAAGKELFLHDWTIGDPLCAEGDGLGPVFNATSCVACHSQGGVGGSGENEHNVLAFEAVPAREGVEAVNHVVHATAVSKEYQETRRTVQDLFKAGGTRLIAGCSVNFTSHCPVIFQEINSPPLFGLGVIEDISTFSISMHDAKRMSEKFADDFSGKFGHNETGFAQTHPGGRVGKFGWKGQFATVKDFVASACAMELGLTNPYKAQPIPREHNENSNAKLDMTHEQLDQLVAFIKSLPPPQQILPSDSLALQRAMQGETLFERVGCVECHVKDMGDAKGVYTDFQLYSLERKNSVDGGPDISGGGQYGGAGNRIEKPETKVNVERPTTLPLPEHWKTPPLWGVADSAPYFHDGQATTLEEAIQRHLGSAKHSHSLYNQLTKDERNKVVEFLKTLRAPQLAPTI